MAFDWSTYDPFSARDLDGQQNIQDAKIYAPIDPNSAEAYIGPKLYTEYGYDPMAIAGDVVNGVGYNPTYAPAMEKYEKALAEEKANPTYRITGGEAGSNIYYDNLGNKIDVTEWNKGDAGGFGWNGAENLVKNAKITDKEGNPVDIRKLDFGTKYEPGDLNTFVRAMGDFRQSRPKPGAPGGGFKNAVKQFTGGKFFGSNPLDTLVNLSTGGWSNTLGLTKDDSRISDLADIVDGSSGLRHGIEKATHGDLWAGVDRFLDLPGGENGPVDAGVRSIGSALPTDVRRNMPTITNMVGSVLSIPTYGISSVVAPAIGRKMSMGAEDISDKGYRRVLTDAGVNAATQYVVNPAIKGMTSGISSTPVRVGTDAIAQGAVKGGTTYALTGDKNQAGKAFLYGAVNSLGNDAVKGLGVTDPFLKSFMGNVTQPLTKYAMNSIFPDKVEQDPRIKPIKLKSASELQSEVDTEYADKKPVTEEDYPGGQFVWHEGTPPTFNVSQTPSTPSYNIVSAIGKDNVTNPSDIDTSETASSRISQREKEDPIKTLASLYGTMGVGRGGQGIQGTRGATVRGGQRFARNSRYGRTIA